MLLPPSNDYRYVFGSSDFSQNIYLMQRESSHFFFFKRLSQHLLIEVMVEGEKMRNSNGYKNIFLLAQYFMLTKLTFSRTKNPWINKGFFTTKIVCILNHNYFKSKSIHLVPLIWHVISLVFVCCCEDFWSYRNSYSVPTKTISSYAKASMVDRKVLSFEVEEISEKN